jgi:RNA polymerase sigma-70 factor (ECF subfamily)
MKQNEKNPESELIARAKKGDMQAFEVLVRKHQQGIYRLCRRMTGAHQSADDLSQETFIKAYFSLPKFKDGRNFYTWIRKIAVNNSLNYLKKHMREEPLDEKESRIPGNSSLTGQELPQDRVQRNHLEQKFKKALKALPADQKIIFCLRFYEDMSYKEISHLMNLPNGTVMSRLNRARKKLKALMSDCL